MGILLGDLFIHILPDTFEKIGKSLETLSKDDHHDHSHHQHLEIIFEHKISIIGIISALIFLNKFGHFGHDHSFKKPNK